MIAKIAEYTSAAFYKKNAAQFFFVHNYTHPLVYVENFEKWRPRALLLFNRVA